MIGCLHCGLMTILLRPWSTGNIWLRSLLFTLERTRGRADPGHHILGDQGVSTSLIRSDVNSLRSFYGCLHKEEVITNNPMEGVPTVKRRRKKQKPVPQAAVDRRLNHVDSRVRLLIRLFCEAGLQRSEAIAARTGELMEDLAGMSLLVHGKGGNDRMLPLSDGLARELSAPSCG